MVSPTIYFHGKKHFRLQNAIGRDVFCDFRDIGVKKLICNDFLARSWRYRCQKSRCLRFLKCMRVFCNSRRTQNYIEICVFHSRLRTLNLKKFPEPRRGRETPRFGEIFKLRPPYGGAACTENSWRAQAFTVRHKNKTNEHSRAPPNKTPQRPAQ